MKKRLGLILSLCVAVPLWAAEEEVCVFELDTRSGARALTNAASVAALRSVTRRPGETISLISPTGEAVELVGADSSVSEAALEFQAGGLWSVSNSVQGTALFTVRHSLYGTLGDGTESSPAKLVDGAELVDYADADLISAPYFFSLNAVPSLFAALAIPSGYRLVEVEGDRYKLVASPDGCEYASGEQVYPLDSSVEGPDRKVLRPYVLPVAYSGDAWAGDEQAPATLSLTSPSGVTTVYETTGSGVKAFSPQEDGVWKILLATATTTLEATVAVRPLLGLMILIQ